MALAQTTHHPFMGGTLLSPIPWGAVTRSMSWRAGYLIASAIGAPVAVEYESIRALSSVFPYLSVAAADPSE